MKVLTFFSNKLVVIWVLTLFDKVNLIFLQTVVTVILEDDKIRTNGGAFVEAVQCNPESRGFDSRWLNWNFQLT
jgi:hypothetical protein